MSRELALNLCGASFTPDDVGALHRLTQILTVHCTISRQGLSSALSRLAPQARLAARLPPQSHGALRNPSQSAPLPRHPRKADPAPRAAPVARDVTEPTGGKRATVKSDLRIPADARGSASLAHAQECHSRVECRRSRKSPGDVGDRGSPQEQVRRTQTGLLVAGGFGTTATQAIGEMAAELAAPRPNARMSDRCDGRLEIGLVRTACLRLRCLRSTVRALIIYDIAPDRGAPTD